MVSVLGESNHMGVFWIARALRPMMDPVHQGIAKMTTDTRLYAGTVDDTSDANDFAHNLVPSSDIREMGN